MSSSDDTFNCVHDNLTTVKDMMNIASSSTTTPNDMFTSIDIDEYE